MLSAPGRERRKAPISPKVIPAGMDLVGRYVGVGNPLGEGLGGVGRQLNVISPGKEKSGEIRKTGDSVLIVYT